MLSHKPWKLEALLRLLMGLFLCVCIGALLASLLRTSATNQPPSVWRMVLGVICFQGVALVFIWRFVREHEVSWKTAFGFGNTPGRAVLFGAVATVLFVPLGFALQAASVKMMTMLGVDPEAQKSVQAISHATAWHEVAAFAIITIVIAPLAEELLFRGILYPAIKQAGFRGLAHWGTAAVFALIHFNLATVLPLFALALVLTMLYEMTGNLVASITMHTLFNTFNLVALFLAAEFGKSLPAQP